MNEPADKQESSRAFAIPAVFVAKKKNIDLLPKKLLWFQASLFILAIPVMILMNIFFPVSIMNSTIWITATVIMLLATVFIRTTMGLFATGICAGFLISSSTMELTNQYWLVGITIISIIYLGSILLKYDKARQEDPSNLETYLTKCNILFLRPFHEEYSKWARNLLIPVFDSYGRVTHATDRSFEEIPFSGLLSNEYRQSYDEVVSRSDLSKAEQDMFKLVEAVTGGDPLHGNRYSNDEWENRVEKLFRQTDIAIIDVSKIGKGLQWEITTAFSLLPSFRVILITRSSKRFRMEQSTLLQSVNLSGIPPQWIYLIEYNPQRPIVFIKQLHKRMQQIVSESLPYLQAKLDEDVRGQNPESAFNTLQSIGDAYFGLEDFGLAKKYYEEAGQIINEQNLRKKETFLLSRLHMLASEMGDKAMESEAILKMLNIGTSEK